MQDSHGRAAVNAAALELVVAVADNDVIGRGNRLPWHLPADLRHFKSLTLGKPILMGRKTYESIGKALPGRVNIVLTRCEQFNPGDCRIVATVDAARRVAGDASALMVIGGAQIYALTLAFATRIHLTQVHARVAGDTFFTGWRDDGWRESFRRRHDADAENPHPYSFVTLERGS